MRFEPSPNDTLSMFGERYVVQPLPSAPHIPYSSEGGRAFVYQLKDQEGGYFALKVFKRKFRNANLADSTRHLARIEKFEGMRAASRRVVLPDATIVKKFPDLEYAMLMPWITGSTWFDVLVRARDHGTYFNRPFAVKLCAQFLKVMAALEQEGYAHSDISQGNLVVGQQQPDVQLLDLEDMYLPGASPPAQDYRGSPGYRHRSGDQGETTWRPEGDRYATAVMAAEMLLLTDQQAAQLATDSGFFASHCQDAVGKERFDFASGLLTNIAPGFTKLFQQAWFSNSLGDCPKIADLREALNEAVAKTGVINTAPPPQVPGVKWGTLGNDQPRITAPLGAPAQTDQRRQTTTRAAAGYWGNVPKSAPAEEPPSASSPPPAPSPPVKVWLIVLAIVALILFLIWLSSSSSRGAHNNLPQPEATLANQLTPSPVVVPSIGQSVPSPASPAP